MALEAIVNLERLNCRRESDGNGHSEPYLWPALVSIDEAFNVGIITPISSQARVVVKNDMRAGETAAIPASVGVLRAQTESLFRALLLVVTLWEEDEFPQQAVIAGFEAFRTNLRAQIIDKLAILAGMDETEKEAAIKEIKEEIADRVESAISGKLSLWEKLTLNFDDIIGSDFKGIISPSAGSIPISIGFNVGRLLFYRDASQTGGGDVSNPSVIGQGAWGQLKSVFPGGNGIIYAVDQDGRLLFYRDAAQNGTGDVSNPSVIGLGGWQQFKFLFSGGNGVIYAVDQQGRLLRYQDATQNGTGDVSSPVVIGQGGWLQFKFLFSGGNGIIYAVDQLGRLLRYQDASQSGGGDVSNPAVIGQGGWLQFKFLFSGGNGIIYAVDHRDSGASDQYEIQGNLQVRPVVVDRCQTEINAVNAAQRVVNDILADIQRLQVELQHASPAEKPFIIREIKRIREEELPIANAALEETRRALQACRG